MTRKIMAAVDRLRALEQAAKSEEVPLAKFKDYFAKDEHYTLCKRLAVVMGQCNWSTVQREDAADIASNAKVTEAGAVAMVDNLLSFLQIASRELKDVKKIMRAGGL